MEGYTGVSGWVATTWGVSLCGVYLPALCEGYARKVTGARFYSVSATQDCFACYVSRTCPEVKVEGPVELANYFYYQMDNPVAGHESTIHTHPTATAAFFLLPSSFYFLLLPSTSFLPSFLPSFFLLPSSLFCFKPSQPMSDRSTVYTCRVFFPLPSPTASYTAKVKQLPLIISRANERMRLAGRGQYPAEPANASSIDLLSSCRRVAGDRPLRSSVHSFVHSFIRSFIHSSIHSFIHSFIHSPIHPFVTV